MTLPAYWPIRIESPRPSWSIDITKVQVCTERKFIHGTANFFQIQTKRKAYTTGFSAYLTITGTYLCTSPNNTQRLVESICIHFSSSTCDWLKVMTSLLLANHKHCVNVYQSIAWFVWYTLQESTTIILLQPVRVRIMSNMSVSIRLGKRLTNELFCTTLSIYTHTFMTTIHTNLVYIYNYMNNFFQVITNYIKVTKCWHRMWTFMLGH